MEAVARQQHLSPVNPSSHLEVKVIAFGETYRCCLLKPPCVHERACEGFRGSNVLILSLGGRQVCLFCFFSTNNFLLSRTRSLHLVTRMWTAWLALKTNAMSLHWHSIAGKREKHFYLFHCGFSIFIWSISPARKKRIAFERLHGICWEKSTALLFEAFFSNTHWINLKRKKKTLFEMMFNMKSRQVSSDP